MEVTNFYILDSSMRFSIIDISMIRIETKAKKLDDQMKFQEGGPWLRFQIKQNPIKNISCSFSTCNIKIMSKYK